MSKPVMKIAVASSAHDVRDPRITLKIAGGLSQRGYQVDLLAGFNDNCSPTTIPYKIHIAGVQWHPLSHGPAGYGTRLKRQKQIWSILQQLKPDVTIIADPELIPLGLTLQKTVRCPVVLDLHEDTSDMHYTKNKILHPLVKQGLKHLSGVVFAFELKRRNRHPAPRIPFTEAYNYYPFSMYKPELKQHKNKILTLIHTGILAEERGTQHFIPLVETINRKGTPCKGILAGRCYQPRHWNTLLNQIKKTSVPDQLIVEGGHDYLSWFRLQQLLEQANMGYMIYPTEGLQYELPTKIYEFTAHHIPVICSKIPAFQQFTYQHQTGKCFNTNSIDSLANKTINYWKDLHSGSINPTFTTINRNKNWSSELNKIEDLISQITSSRFNPLR